MKPYKKFRLFQIRWKEALGKPECPYLYRWTLLFFGFSIRLHHWIRSDDKRFFHDHACNLISIILKGFYLNVTPDGTFLAKAFKPRYMNALQRHYLSGMNTIELFTNKKHAKRFYRDVRKVEVQEIEQ